MPLAKAMMEAAGNSTQPVYVEDVYSTFLYQGNGSTQTITNGIDLAGKGGLTWIKRRDAVANHALFDTARGATKKLYSDLTNAEYTDAYSLTAFNSNGFSLNLDGSVNNGSGTYSSWTFRKQAKFFDVVTWTGNGVNGRAISHSLGSVPGCIMVKRTDTTGNWQVYHRSAAADPSIALLVLNTTAAVVTDGNVWWSTPPTSTEFTVGGVANVNASGGTYVAYLLAHNAGGFGLTGTDNVISCGMATMPAGGGPVTVNLGWEPQWVLMKDINHTGGCQWFIQDNMRGWPAESTSAPDYKYLQAHLSSAEGTSNTNQGITSTGFSINSGFNYADGNTNIIYIAIRRGPMKTPTSGTSVYTPFYFAGDSSTSRQLTASGPTDLFYGFRTVGDPVAFVDRLRGKDLQLFGSYPDAETTANLYCRFDSNTGPIVGYNASGININSSAYNYRAGAFRRAPGFFDEVCWTGNGTGVRVYHNLGVAPELIILKNRSQGTNWIVRPPGTPNNYMVLNSTAAVASGAGNYINNPTATYFDTGDNAAVNTNAATYVAYLFASCPGVSKVGSYTGTGTTQQINCGFTAGARFVLIKRTDSTGDWYVWDSARGIVSGNDPYFLFNSPDSEVTNTDYVDTYSAGFEISSTAPAAINASGGTFIYLAIA